MRLIQYLVVVFLFVVIPFVAFSNPEPIILNDIFGQYVDVKLDNSALHAGLLDHNQVNWETAFQPPNTCDDSWSKCSLDIGLQVQWSDGYTMQATLRDLQAQCKDLYIWHSAFEGPRSLHIYALHDAGPKVLGMTFEDSGSNEEWDEVVWFAPTRAGWVRILDTKTHVSGGYVTHDPCWIGGYELSKRFETSCSIQYADRAFPWPALIQYCKKRLTEACNECDEGCSVVPNTTRITNTTIKTCFHFKDGAYHDFPCVL